MAEISITEVLRRTGMTRQRLEWWQAQGFFTLEHEDTVDERWLEWWKEYLEYGKAGFRNNDAADRAHKAVFN
jgi:hypothetical protein